MIGEQLKSREKEVDDLHKKKVQSYLKENLQHKESENQ